MNKMAIVLSASLLLTAGAALAQYPDYRNDPYWAARQQQAEQWRYEHRDDNRWRDDRARDDHRDDWECWNPHAGHFEGVRPGETQNDLDFSRCRPKQGQLLTYPGYYGAYR